MYSDYKVNIFNQPGKQRFREDDGKPVGLIGAGLSIPLTDEGLEFFIKGDAKSEGWIEGNVYLGKSIQTHSGILIHF